MIKTIQYTLRVMLCLGLSTLLLGCDDDSTPVNSSEYHDVIVIGAGMSGLEAASVLKEKNIDVVILEARNRVGGRLETTTMDGAYTDLGASWLHNVAQNPLTVLANKVGESLIPTPASPETVSIYDNGVLVDPNDVFTIFSYFPALTQSLVGLQYVTCGALSSAIDCFIQNYIPPSPTVKYATYTYNLLLASWFGDDTSYVSSSVGPSFLNPGTDALPATGYTNFINKIFNIPALNIILNSVVNKINYAPNQVVINTTNNKSYRAKYVVITVPIGVLKKNTIQFVPALPKDKQLAIQHIGYGLLNKIFLQFDEIFWDNNLTLFLPYTPNPAVNYYLIFNYAKFVNKPILFVLDSGDFASSLEKLSDAEITASIMTQIRLIYPTAPDPVNVYITRWEQDAFSYGSYSVPTLDTTFEDYKNLTLPVQNTLFFAGEAVNVNKNGTADAAYESGKHAAEAILDTMIQGRNSG